MIFLFPEQGSTAMSQMPPSEGPGHEPSEQASGPNQPSQPHPGAPPQKSGMATAALILGVIALATSCVLLGLPVGILALILGLVALGQIDKAPQHLTGRGKARAGAILGGLSVALGLVVPLLIGIMLLPALSAARNAARKAQNENNLRIAATSLITFGNDQGAYPSDDMPDVNPAQEDFGPEARARTTALIVNDYFTPEVLINPTDARTAYQGPVSSFGPQNWLDNQHISYDMLALEGSGSRPDKVDYEHPAWKQTLNSQAVLLVDRNTNPGGPAASVWNNQPGGWKGTMVWGDGHASYEQDAQVDAKVDGQLIAGDNIWRDDRQPGVKDDLKMTDDLK
jgi:type II secretory pathway pseudopilin PulG